jgi:hypothetical protein
MPNGCQTTFAARAEAEPRLGNAPYLAFRDSRPLKK